MVKKFKKKKENRTNFNEELFVKLKEVRDKIAEDKRVPNFIILNDSVLKELSYYYPTNKQLFLLIKGIGENKFEDYGIKLLPVIEEFICNVNDLEKRHKELKKLIEPEKSKINIKKRTEVRKARVKELILKKKCIEDIADDLGLTPNTIVNYIGRLLADGSGLDVQYIKDSVEGYNDIVRAFEKHGTEKIGPIYSEFGGNVEYADITLVKVLLGSK